MESEEILTREEQEQYGAKDIEILEGIEAVRKRPAMYIGDTSERGLHHLVQEVVDNSIDEAMAGYCSKVVVRLHEDGSVSIQDDGRGIPVDMHDELGVPAVEVVMTTLHAGGKFTDEIYKVSGGLHGVGVSVVNALSEWLEVDIWREGHHYFQSYDRGLPTGELEDYGSADKTGTRIQFKPDDEIFQTTNLEFDLLSGRLRELAYLNEGLEIQLIDERSGRDETYLYEGGINEYLEHLHEDKQVLHPDVISIDEEQDDVQIKIAAQYNEGYNQSLFSFVNNINTQEGGTHESGFKTAVTRALKQYAKKNDLLSDDLNPTGQDFREGLTAIISVNVPDPQFEGQTKTKLGNQNVRSLVQTTVYDVLSIYLEEHPDAAAAITNKALEAAEARKAAQEAKEEARRKSALTSGSMPGKLADCSSRTVEDTELFVVEGDSAGGSAKQARDREFQAILPIKGKVLNAQKARLKRILEHDELKTLIQAIGTGIGEEDFDLSNLRYGKVIIMTDADVDGSHIRTLLLTFLFRHMRQLLVDGHVYVACPPLYRIERKNQERYIRTEKEMRNALLELGQRGSVFKNTARDISLDGEDLDELVEHLIRLQELFDGIEQKGVNPRRFLQYKKDEGTFPLYRVKSSFHDEICFSDARVQEIIDDVSEKIGEEPKILHGDDFLPDSDHEQVRVIEFHGGNEINSIIDELGKFGFTLDHCMQTSRFEEDLEISELSNDATDTPFMLQSNGDTFGIENPLDILKGIQHTGEKGISIQRYKGLGEMNPQQLWETTMDPERRMLLQVQVDNTAEAERLFDILMGETVKPRREFIQQFALDVQFLDV